MCIGPAENGLVLGGEGMIESEPRFQIRLLESLDLDVLPDAGHILLAGSAAAWPKSEALEMFSVSNTFNFDAGI
jgi:hypothetical protein